MSKETAKLKSHYCTEEILILDSFVYIDIAHDWIFQFWREWYIGSSVGCKVRQQREGRTCWISPSQRVRQPVTEGATQCSQECPARGGTSTA